MALNYYRFKVENLINIKEIITMFDFYHVKGYKSIIEKHNFYEINYCPEGQFYVNIKEEKIEVNKGEIICIKPNTVHSLETPKSDNRVLIISFSTSSLAMSFFDNRTMAVSAKALPILNMLYEVGDRFFLLNEPNPETKKMSIQDNAPLGGLQTIKNLLEIFLIELIKQDRQENIRFELSSDDLVKKIEEILKANVDKNIKIDDISKQIGYSKSYIFKIFKQKKDETIITYYTKLKINRAKELIRFNSYSISEISNLLGFDTPNYFTKTFKKVTGVTPLSYKKGFNV